MGLATPLEDVQDVRTARLHEVELNRVDEARRRDSVTFRESVDGVDQNEGPFG